MAERLVLRRSTRHTPYGVPQHLARLDKKKAIIELHAANPLMKHSDLGELTHMPRSTVQRYVVYLTSLARMQESCLRRVREGVEERREGKRRGVWGGGGGKPQPKQTQMPKEKTGTPQ